MLKLTRDDLMHIAPRPKSPSGGPIWDSYVAALTSVQAVKLFDQYEINSPLRIQHALATMVAETNLCILWESGAYTAVGILRVFGVDHHSSAVTQSEAVKIASLPVNADGSGPRCEALFERVYGCATKIGRSMGNIERGDGWKYRGAMLNQLTGKVSHARVAATLGVPIENLVTPLNALNAFLIEWKQKNCNKYADRDDPVSIRKLINGGSLSVSVSRINGLPEAQAALRRAKAVITAADFQSTPATQVAAIIPDVPDKGSSVPSNADAPVSLYSSTEMQAGATAGTTTGVAAGNSWYDCLPRAFDRATSSGKFSISMFLFALLSDPVAWAAIGATVATSGVLYLMLMRYKRYFHFGV